MVKVLSIDIGLLNLSLCILDTSQIHLWKLLDIAKQVQVDPILCSSSLKSGTPCSKKATFCSKKKPFCGLHNPAKKDTSLVVTTQKQPKKKKISSMSIQNFCWNATCELQKLTSHFSEITDVVIELQPVLNRKMVMMSHFIYNFFVTFFENKVPVKLWPAYHKLSVYNGPLVICNLKSAYSKRKYLSVEYTKHFLELTKYIKYKPLFMETTKKDDLADSFLMGLCYIEKKLPPPKPEDGLENVKSKRRKKLKF